MKVKHEYFYWCSIDKVGGTTSRKSKKCPKCKQPMEVSGNLYTAGEPFIPLDSLTPF